MASKAAPTLPVFQFRMGAALVALAPRNRVLKHIPIEDFQSLFGGHIGRLVGRSEYLGVWGARKVSRFRRILRERGATIRVLGGEPRAVRLVI